MVSGGIGFGLCHHPYMTQPYQWTTDDNEVAFDAIIVRIDDTTAEPLANVYWPKTVTSEGVFAAGQHMGWPVVEALDRAHELSAMMNVPRIVITIAERGMWRDEWGTLAETEGD